MLLSFAKLDSNNVVESVIVIDSDELENADFPESETEGANLIVNSLNLPGIWKQTSINGEFRKFSATTGSIYDEENDIFLYPKPYPSWILDENFIWKPPIDYPLDNNEYVWDEDTLSWKPINH